MDKKVVVIGAGAWGTALATVCVREGVHPILFGQEKDVAESINTKHENIRCHPGVKLDSKITATVDPEILKDAEVIIVSVPAQATREALKEYAPLIGENVPLVLTAKGIEQSTGMLQSEIVAEVLPENPIAVISGPNFAHEVVAGKPAAATLACKDQELRATLSDLLASPRYRIYLSDDIIGVQVGGAVKNVLAIACGFALGKDLGDNAVASLVTRGLVEMARLGIAKGADKETFMGLSGAGDLMLTCMGSSSRNRAYGVSFVKEGKKETGTLVEGYFTTLSIKELASKLGVQMPICDMVFDIVHKGHDVEESIHALLSRPMQHEEKV